MSKRSSLSHLSTGLSVAGTLMTMAMVVAVLAMSVHAESKAVGPEAAAPTDNSAVYDVPRLEGITIDGNVEDWKDQGFRVQSLCTAAGMPDADVKASASLRFGWDDRGLLLLLVVVDETPYEADGTNYLWEGDSIEIFTAAQRDGGFVQTMVGPGRDGHNDLRYRFYDHRTNLELKKVPLQFKVARTKTAKGYLLEALLPWENLGIKPEQGREIGFQIHVNDYDGSGRTKLMWYPQETVGGIGANMERLRLALQASAVVKASQELGTTTVPSRAVSFRAINAKTKEPVPGVKVESSFFYGPTWYDHVTCTQFTDAQGGALLAYPERAMQSYSMHVSRKGFVSRTADWRSSNPPPLSPEVYTIEMEPATPVGGVVKNQQGESVAGAEVGICYVNYGNGPRAPGQAYEEVYERVRTDKEGRWQIACLPDKFSPQVYVRHSDYISDEWAPFEHPTPKYPQPSVQELQSLSSEIVLKRGMVVEGYVVDDQGRPVPDAVVHEVYERDVVQPVRANEKGYFRFSPSASGVETLTIAKDGFAPQMQAVTLSPDATPLRIQLAKGQTLRGRVMDKQGIPVAGAAVAVETWQGKRGALDLKVTTDTDGRFTWNGAPADAVTLSISKEGYMPRSQSVTAGEEECLLTLVQPLKVTGKVVDKETNEPVAAFKVIPGIDFGQGSQTHFDRRSAKSGKDGAYSIDFTYPYPGHLVRIEADGYRPANSRVITNDEGQVTIDFALEKGKNVSGTVRLSDGSPAVGAKVIVATPSQCAYIQNGAKIVDQGCITVTTGSDGRFSLPPLDSVWKLVIVHDGGYAEVSQAAMAKSGDIALAAWGRVEGKVLIGSKPAANAEIVAYRQPSEEEMKAMREPSNRTLPRANFDMRTHTDADGGFVLDRMPAGEWQVGREVQVGNNFRSQSGSERVTLTAGQTVKISLGGKGRPVIGQLVAPEGAAIDFSKVQFPNIRTKVDLPRPPLPENFEQMDMPAKREWQKKWLVSEEGQAYVKAQQEAYRQMKSYAFAINPDGTFRVEDIPAGHYVMQAVFGSYEAQGGNTVNRIVGAVNHDFLLPEMPEGRSDEPLDLGKLPVQMQNATSGPALTTMPATMPTTAPANAGAPAKLSGKPLPNADALGLKDAMAAAGNQRLLVCFWDQSQRPSRETVTALGKMAEQLAAKGVSVMLVSAGDDASRARQWLADAKIGFPCGQVPAEAGKALGDWNARRMPWLILTDKAHIVEVEGISLPMLQERVKGF